MSTEVVKQELQAITTITEQTIKDFLFGSETKLTPEQQVLFMKTAVTFNLNPFKREIYAIPYQEKSSGRYKMNIVTGYDVYLKRAERIANIDGWKAWTEDDKDGRPIKAKIIIYRKDWKNPFEHEVYFNEYYQGNKIWNEKPHTMIKKVVTAQGFRMCFPDELGGMPYTADEMPDEMTTITTTAAKVFPKPVHAAEKKAIEVAMRNINYAPPQVEQVVTTTAEVVVGAPKHPTEEETVKLLVDQLVEKMKDAGDVFTPEQIEKASKIKTRTMLILGEKKYDLEMRNADEKKEVAE